MKDPNWSHPGKYTSYPRRSIPVTTTSTDPSSWSSYRSRWRAVIKRTLAYCDVTRLFADSVAHHYPSLVFRSRWPRSDALNVRFPAMRNPA